MQEAKPILIVRVHYQTPRDQAERFGEMIAQRFDDYHTLCLQGREMDIQFETHNADNFEPIEFEELKEMALECFEEKGKGWKN